MDITTESQDMSDSQGDTTTLGDNQQKTTGIPTTSQVPPDGSQIVNNLPTGGAGNSINNNLSGPVATQAGSQNIPGQQNQRPQRQKVKVCFHCCFHCYSFFLHNLGTNSIATKDK